MLGEITGEEAANAHAHRRIRGFTLIELLVALLVFAVLSVMTYGGLRHVLAVKRHSDAESSRLADLEMTFLFIGRDLAQAVERGVRDQLGTAVPAFSGGQGRRRLLELTCFTGGDGRLVRVEYVLEGDRLQRRRWPVLDAMPETMAEGAELLDGVTAMQLRFLAKQWQATWPAPDVTAALPRAVELTMRLREGTEIRRLFMLPNA